MPVNLTLKNIPDALYEQLKTAASSHRRSLNSEAIVCLESVLLPSAPDANDALARVRALRSTLAGLNFSAAEIDQLKQEGRA